MWQGKKIVLGITGSIAAYKAIYLVRLLVKAGAEVKVVMTPAARQFVSPLTLATVSRNPVLIELSEGDTWANHVMLGRWADILLIAPLSCNTLAKMAHGHCDNLLLAVYLSAVCPVVVAPAMDEDMWKHPATKNNLSLLASYGNHLIPVEHGDLASGLQGDGRMSEPETILDFIASRFFLTRPLAGKTALVTAGPTYEAIDPVRFIGNHSSGKMGIAIAKELASQGANVNLVLGPVQTPVALPGVTIFNVQSAGEMYTKSTSLFDTSDLAILAAAVADYTPATPATEKIKKKEASLTLELVKTKDILKSLGEKKRDDQVLVGFALETSNEKAFAKEKLATKKADMIILNSLNDKGAGFGHDTNKITIFGKSGSEQTFEMKSKTAVAADIVAAIIREYYA